MHSEVKYQLSTRNHLSPLCTILLNTSFQLLAIAYVFFFFLSACDIKTSNFLFLGGWGGDISSSDSRAFYKFLQKIQANWIKFILRKRNIYAVMNVFFPLSKVAGLSLLSITWRAKKKVYTIVFHGYIQMYFQRNISYSVSIPIFHGIYIYLMN